MNEPIPPSVMDQAIQTVVSEACKIRKECSDYMANLKEIDKPFRGYCHYYDDISRCPPRITDVMRHIEVCMNVIYKNGDKGGGLAATKNLMRLVGDLYAIIDEQKENK